MWAGMCKRARECACHWVREGVRECVRVGVHMCLCIWDSGRGGDRVCVCVCVCASMRGSVHVCASASASM